MKKLLYSSIVLLLFSTSILLFQISCQKDAEANSQEDTSSTSQQLNKLVFKKLSWPSQKIISEIWIVNYDGSNATKVNITLPNEVVFSTAMIPVMSPDGKKIFFTAGPKADQGSNGYYGDLYSCDINGTNVTKIISKAGGDIILGGAY